MGIIRGTGKVCAIAVGLLAACGDDGGGPADSGIDAPTTQLEGTWTGGCLPLSGPPGTDSAQWSVEYSTNQYTAIEEYYEGARCIASALSLRLTERGTFTIGGAGTVAGSTNIDYLQSAITGTTANGYAATINGAQTCTGVTFVDGTEVSLSGVTCAGMPASTNGSTLLGLYKLDTAPTPDTLALGEVDGIGQVGDATRPTALRTDLYERP